MGLQTHEPAYRHKGPPAAALRLHAPLVVASTLVVFVTGVLLLFDGPVHRDFLVLAQVWAWSARVFDRA